MERRMLAAILLSFVAVISYWTLTGRCSVPPPDKTAEKKQGEPKDGEKPAPETNGTQPAAPAPAPAPEQDGPQKDVGPQEAVTLANDEFEVGFTSQGGAVEWVRLKNAFEADKKTPLDLVLPADPYFLLGQIDDRNLVPAEGAPGSADRKDDPAGEMRRLHWTRDRAREAATPEEDVVYTFRRADGITLVKTFTPARGAGRYDIHFSLAAEGAAQPVEVKVLVASGVLREERTGAQFLPDSAALVRMSDMNEPLAPPWGIEVKTLDTEGVNPGRVAMLGARTQHFMAVFYERSREDAAQVVRFWATGQEKARSGRMEQNVREFFERVRGRPAPTDSPLEKRIKDGVDTMFHVWMVVRVPAGPEAKPVRLNYYVGPISRDVLAAEPYAALAPVIAYPMAFDFLADFLLWIYDRFRFLFLSAGLAVILMTFVVRGALMPLSIRNQLSMRRYGRRVQKLKPKLEELKKKFGNNPKRFRDEQMKLYREHGIGFPLGCVMMFFQIPIFFALFSCLRVEYTLRNNPFLWIPDLSGPDRLISLPSFEIPIIGAMMGPISSLNILPILYLGLTWWQQRLMPKPIDEQQAQQMRMMKWMPIFFAVLLYNYTAALALYMITSSALAIVESRMVKHMDEKALAAAAAGP